MFGLSKVLEQKEAQGNPIRIALVGVGTMGTLFATTAGQAPGMSIDIVADLNVQSAVDAMLAAGYNQSNIVQCETLEDTEKALKAGKKVVTSQLEIACAASPIEVVYEATGVPEVYARTGIAAINHKKHFITMTVEGDVCVGHLMNQWARNAGVVYSGIYGDEPGSAMLQYYEAKALGFEVLAIGRSDQGGSDLKWNKETIKPELKKYGSDYKNPAIFASFCDGSKTNQECTMMANATGFRPDVRGMHGPTVPFDTFVHDVPHLLRPKSEGGILDHTGVVEYIGNPTRATVGRASNFIWVFVVVRCKTQAHKNWLIVNKGVSDGSDTGIFYCPYHMGSLQSPVTVATAAIDHRAVVAPLEGNKRAADTITMAKMDLKAGDVIDEIGGFATTGRIEVASVTRQGNYLPFALAAGAKLKRDIPKMGFITYDDVEFDEKPSVLRRMRALQDMLFGDLH